MKRVNFSEKGVSKEYKNSKFIELIGKPTFRRLICCESWGAINGVGEDIFVKGQSYDIWICNVYKKKEGTFAHYVAVPKIIEEKGHTEKYRYILPQTIFGKIDDREEAITTQIEVNKPKLVVKDEHIEELETEICKEKFKLIPDFNNSFLLIPSWYLNKEEVEQYIKAKDVEVFSSSTDKKTKSAAHWLKLYPHLPQKYMLIPRIFGTSTKNMFIAWEIRIKMNKKTTLATYFNIYNGCEDCNWQDLDIQYPLGNNQKQAQVKRLYVRYSKKKINVSFKRI